MWWSRPHWQKQTMIFFSSETNPPQLPHGASIPAFPQAFITTALSKLEEQVPDGRQGHWSFPKTMKTILWEHRVKVEETCLWGQQPSGSREVMENIYMTFPRAGPHGHKKDHGHNCPLGNFQTPHWNSPTQRHWRDQKRCFWLNIYHRWTLSLTL